MSEHVRVEKNEGVLTLVIDRPGKKNALTDGMYDVLASALESAQTDPAVRVAMIRSEGEIFTSGNDIGEFAAVAMGAPLPANVGRFLRILATFEKPLVAAVQGKAVGIGTTLLLHCDQVVLADDASLSAPFVNLALVPEAASSLLLPAFVGHVRAFAMFALGEAVDAPSALAWGLANRVVPRAELATVAADLAGRLARQPLGALVVTKKLMRPSAPVTARMQEELEQFVARLVTAEAREAFTAFAERRAPDFTKIG